MNRHFPLLIFVSSAVLFLGLKWAGSRNEELATAPPLQNNPQSNDSRVTQRPEAHTIEHGSGALSDAPQPSIVWFFQDSDRLRDKLDTCDVPNTLHHGDKVSTIGWFHIANAKILLFTKHVENPDATIKLHLKTLTCLFHRTIEAQDAVTEHRFTSKNWPRLTKNETLPLSAFIRFKPTKTGVETVGLKRLGRLDLRWDQTEAVEVLWRIVSFYLVSQELDQTLKVYELPYRAVKVKNDYLYVESVQRTEGSTAPARELPTRRSSSRARGTTKAAQPSTPSETRKMPEYR